MHTNSGVNNKAAYLLVNGGTFNGRTIGALGLSKVLTIYYEAQTNLLTSGSDYLDLDNALYQACLNRKNTNGITFLDCKQVRNATLAVKMNKPPAVHSIRMPAIAPQGSRLCSRESSTRILKAARMAGR